jgi:hypothetical protein
LRHAAAEIVQQAQIQRRFGVAGRGARQPQMAGLVEPAGVERAPGIAVVRAQRRRGRRENRNEQARCGPAHARLHGATQG